MHEGSFGLYVHWPFCQSKCPYCDFNSHVRAEIDQSRWAKALTEEIAYFAANTDGRPLETIFFGGGTPSLMEPEVIASVIDAARREWGFSNDIEITMEANPSSVEAERFAGYAASGVNRVSLGVQSLNDDALKFLGRQHSAADALKAIKIASETFNRWSLDLIYALPEQSQLSWENELYQALSFGSSHLSAYQLTIEPGTAFHGAHARGLFQIPEDDFAGQLFEATQSILSSAGLLNYEISNHAYPGQEARHNLIYWRGGSWVGVGPGAHGRLGVNGHRTAFRQVKTPEAWISRVEASGNGVAEKIALTAVEIGQENLMMGLRLKEGVNLDRLSFQTGLSLEALTDKSALKPLIDGGFLELNDSHLCATADGRQRLNAVLSRLMS